VGDVTKIRYLIVEKDGKWKINLGSLKMGSFTNRLGAISAAIDMADRDGRNGGDAQVLVRREEQELLIEWTYGRDPYPEYTEFVASSKRAVRKRHSIQAKALRMVRPVLDYFPAQKSDFVPFD
jgi:hypothetical protein